MKEATQLTIAQRRASVIAAGIAAALLAISVGAWACTAHTGGIWFCTSSSGCLLSGSEDVWQVNAEAWVDGDGLLANKTGVSVRYGPALVDASCMSGVEMTTIDTDSTGSVVTPKMVNMPSTSGDWKACAVTTSTTTGTAVVVSSNHSAFTTI